MRLSDLYPALTTSEREQLAVRAQMSPGYLWQIANRWRGKAASIGMIRRICAADSRLTLAELVEEFTEPVPDVPGRASSQQAIHEESPNA